MTPVFAGSLAAERTVNYLVQAYVIVLVARALVSWFPLSPGSPMVGVVRVLDRLTEPVLRPLRRIIPPLGGIDLSIIVAILGIEIIGRIVVSYV
ncbi:MAG: YggT family protein [Acidimicrobiales bacterium]